MASVRDYELKEFAARVGVSAIDELEEEGEITPTEAGKMLAAKGFDDAFIRARGFTPPDNTFLLPDEYEDLDTTVSGWKPETINYASIPSGGNPQPSLNPLEWAKTEIIKQFNAILKRFNDAIGGVTSKLVNLVTGIKNSVSSILGTVIDKLKGFISTIWGGVTGIISDFTSLIRRGYDATVEAIKNISRSIFDLGTRIKEAVTQAIVGAAQAIKNTMSNVLAATLDKIKELFTSFRDYSIKLQETFRENFRTAINVFKSGIEGISSAVLAGFKYLVDELIRTIAYIVDDLNNLLGVSTEAIAESVEAAMRAGMSLARQLGEELAAQAAAPTVSTGPIPTAVPRRVI